MKANVYLLHRPKGGASWSGGWLGKYSFSIVPQIGDIIYSSEDYDAVEYIVTERKFELKKFGRTALQITVERKND